MASRQHAEGATLAYVSEFGYCDTVNTERIYAAPKMYLSWRPRLPKLEATRPPKTAVQTTAHATSVGKPVQHMQQPTTCRSVAGVRLRLHGA